MSAYLYVDGLASSVSEEDVKTLFSSCGTVLSVEILPALEGKYLGIAQVQMGSAEEGNRAIQVMNKTRLDGNILLVFRDPGMNGKVRGHNPS